MTGEELLLACELKQLLQNCLSDGALYSALVPWVLDSDRKGLTLSQYAQERQCLQHVQLQSGHARPHDMQQCVLQIVTEVCTHAAGLSNAICPDPAAAEQAYAAVLQTANANTTPRQHSNGKLPAGQQGIRRSDVAGASSGGCSCSLSQPASRLAKLHGHLLSHLAAPNLAEQLHQLLLLLTAGPLDTSSTSAATGAKRPSSRTSTGKATSRNQQADNSATAQAPKQQQPTCYNDGLRSPQQLLSCKGCAAAYAAKALECCSKLLVVMPLELQQALAHSPHLQQYNPGLSALLTKTLAAAAAGVTPGTPGAAAAASLATAATPWQQQQGGPGVCEVTPAPAAAGSGALGRPAVLGWAATGGPGSAGSTGAGAPWAPDSTRSLPSSSGRAGGGPRSSRTPASVRLSGLGLLMPTTPGTGLPSRPASAGQLPAGGKAAKTAAVCNREKCRDLFFSILRRASSRLEGMRQVQEAAAAAAADGCAQQTAAAEAAAAADMAELLGEVGLAAKQLLLQLAPANMTYLAELFMACVLQSASTGEALLEPALLLMAEKDPSRFHKLQQRLADRPAGGVDAALPAAAAGGQAGSGSTNTSRHLARTGPGAASKEQQMAKQGAQQQQQQGVGDSRSVGGAMHSNGAPGSGESLAQIMQGRTRTRPTKQQQQQQAPHILATAGGCGVHSQGGNSGPSSSSGPKRLVPQRHIIPQPAASSNQGHQQQELPGAQQLSSQRLSGAAVSRIGHAAAASPVPLAAGVGAVDSPLPASCLSPLFAAATESPLTAQPMATPANVASSSSSTSRRLQVVPVTAGNGVSAAHPQGQQQQAAAGPGSSSILSNRGPGGTPAQSSTLLQQRPAAPATVAAGKGARSAAAAAGVSSGSSSAPPKLQAAIWGSNTPNTGPAAATASPALLQQQAAGPAQVMLRMLQALPASQHVLLLLLHAADSSSFNGVLLGVLCGRVEKLLSSSPGSFTAASGLGQQASAITALGCYCSYLCFAAGAAAAAAPDGPAGRSHAEGPFLQQQPLLDIAALLQRLLRGCITADSSEQQQQQRSDPSDLDAAWRMALAVPFAVSCMRLAELNPSAAASPSVHAAVNTLQALRSLAALSPSSAGFGALPVCVGCCIQACSVVQGPASAAAAAAAAAAAVHEGWGVDAAELCRVLAAGSCLVDGSYWSICCPGLQQLVALLNAATVAAAVAASSTAVGSRSQQQQQYMPVGKGTSTTTPGEAARGQAAAAGVTPQPRNSTLASASKAPGMGSGEDAEAATSGPPQAAGSRAQGSSSSSSSPAGGPARHTTPLLLAPRCPPEVPSPPPAMAAALADVSDPMRQQLQQAFIAQYSTDDNPVKMRDVLTVINGILFANSLSQALSQGLPHVLQKHLDALTHAVTQQLTPGVDRSIEGGSSNTQLQGQDCARAVHALYSTQLAAALPEALESAMQAAADHACRAATAACGSLLPADVPPAAAATAAALVTASCKASCAQRLLQEVPVLVQSTLADTADDLVRLVNRQWAVHNRITAAAAGAGAGPAGGGPMGPITRSDAGSGTVVIARSSSSSKAIAGDSKQPARLQPVKLDAGATPAPLQTTSTADAVGSTGRHAAGALSVPAPLGEGEADAQPSAGANSSTPASNSSNCGVARGSQALAAADAHDTATGGAADSADPHTRKADGTTQATPCHAASTDVPCASSAAAAGVRLPGTFLEPTAGPAAASPARTPATLAASGEVCSSPASAVSSFMHCARDTLAAAEQWGCSVQQQDVVAQLVTAAEAAAQQLVVGVADGRIRCSSLEQQLIQALQQAQAAQHRQHVQQQGEQPASCSAGGLQQELQEQAAAKQQQQQQQQEEHLLLLLSGAAMHALLCSARIKANVWQLNEGAAADVAAQQHGDENETGVLEGQAAAAAAAGGSQELSHFTQLPVLLMKAARGAAPVWLLRQLRQWMQAATLGCH